MIADTPHSQHTHADLLDAQQGPGADAFDALADLFLGEMNAVASHDAAMGLTPAGRANTPASPGRPDRPPLPPRMGRPDHSARAGRASHGDPGQIGDVGPKLTLVREHAEALGEPGMDVAIHGLGDIDLLDAAEDEPLLQRRTPLGAIAPAPAPPCVEALVLGHLPVMAAAWTNQYVRHVADKVQGPVALVRVSRRGLRIDLHTPGGVAGEASGASTAAGMAINGELDDAVMLVQRTARRVVIVSDSAAELDTACQAGIGRVTLLTSGDEAGVVAAYGLIKSLAQRLRSRDGGTPGELPDALLRIAIMGAPPSRAEYVLARLQRAARTFLGMSLQSEACIARIGGGAPARNLFSGDLEAPPADLIAMLAVGDARPAGVGPSQRTGESPEQSSAPVSTAAPTRPTAPAPAAAPASAPGSSPGAMAMEPSAFWRRAERSTPEAESADRAPEGSLTLHIPGLMALEARCPLAPEVELAIDEFGAMHALARAESHAQAARALQRLMIASSWAESNRRVLELTLRGGGSRWIGAGAPTMHVFTDQPKLWRGMLESPLKLHLLAVVDRAANPDWVCAELN